MFSYLDLGLCPFCFYPLKVNSIGHIKESIDIDRLTSTVICTKCNHMIEIDMTITYLGKKKKNKNMITLKELLNKEMR